MAWKRKLRWIAIVLLGTVAILGIAGLLVLRSEGLHRYVLAQIEKQASEATGARVHIQDFALRLSGLRADAYGITIRGSESATAAPLAQADQLMIRVRIVSLRRKKIDLSEIVLRHPVVNLAVRKDGTTNLPSPPQSKSSSSSNPFDLGIQHVLLEHGEIYYNDVKTPLDAELHELKLEIKSGMIGKGYDGHLSYRDGRVQYGETKAFPHDLTASFQATPSEFTLQPLVLTIASSTIELNGQLQNYSQPSVSGSYKITLHPQDAGPALKNDAIPTGEFILTGSLRYQQQANVPAMRAVAADGRLYGRELAINTSDLRTVVRNIRGEFKLLNGNLDVRGVEADLLGGHLTATATMQHLEANPSAKLHASMQAISLTAANAALRNASLNPMPMDGQMSGAADAGWTGSAKNITARSELILKAALTGTADSAPIPVEGMVHATYEGRSNLATVTNTFVRTPQTRLEIEGTASQKLNVKLRGHAADLKEVESVAAAFQKAGTPSSGPTASTRSMHLAGAADLQVLIEGSMDDPHIRGQLSGRSLQAENTEWRSLEMRLQAGKSDVSIQNGSLVNAHQGFVNFAGSTGLSNWHYLPSSPLSLEVTSRELAIEQLLQLAQLDYPVSGSLSVDLSLHGSQLNPVGTGSVHLVQAKLYGQSVQQLSIQSQGNGDALSSSLDMSLPAGSAKGKVIYYPKRNGYELQLEIPGVNLAQLQAVQERNLGATGVLSLTASGRGTFDDPQLTATAQIPRFQVRDASISGIKAEINVANHQAHVAMDSEVAATSVQARATINLSNGHYTRASLDTQGMPIEGLFALYAPAKSNGPRGVVEVHASAEGPMDDRNRIQGQVIIPTLKADYQGLRIGNARPIRVHYANSLIVLDPTEITGTDTTLRVQGQLPLQGSAPMTLAAVGSVDMQLLRFFQSDLQSSGKLLLDVRGTGSASNPSVQGQLQLQNIAMMPADAPVGLQNLNGVLEVSNDQVNIAQLTGEAGGGQVSAHGVVGYRPQLQMNVAVQAKNIRIRYQDAIRTVLGGDLNLTGTSQAAKLNGRVLIDSLSFTQNFDLATFAGQVQSGPESTPSEGMANKIKLDIAVQTARDLNLTSSAVSLQGQANLHVVGTAADPVIVGRTEFTAGDIFLMNKRYQIERGIIEFSNPNRTEPVLNVLLTTTISQYNLSLTFRGPLDKMQTSYVSDPPLPTADIINLIARGQTSQQAAASPSNFGASSLLAQGAASQVSSGVQKLAGLSSLSIDPTLGGNNSDPGARIAMQKRVTNNFLFTFATDVTSTQREIIQGEYQLSKRWSASVTRDENGGFAVDGKYHKRY
jgi:translocation and assembly module TamB